MLKIGDLVYLQDGSGAPLRGEGVWTVQSLIAPGDYPVFVTKDLGDGTREGTYTTPYRVGSIREHDEEF